jgi:3-phenylpropionate/trans-cinnamate dioxygenase ferredoxin subunit
MTETIDICPLSDLPPGALRTVEWEDIEIMVVNCNGELLAMEDRCSHDDGPLVEGEIDQATCAPGFCVKRRAPA